MKLHTRKLSPFLISVVLVLAATALICTFTFACSGGKLKFKTTFYFVCYAIEDNSISASSISSAVSSYGGAGYILEYDGAYYVTVACYYDDKDAEMVCNGLKKKNVDCSVLKIETKEYRLPRSAKNNLELYKGNLNTLNSLSSLAYDCANALDTGSCSQSNAKNVINNVKSGLNGLLSANTNNCFTAELRRLIAVCSDAGGDIIYSKDLRRLQIAIADTLINAELY